eukprot:COSAG03_NODE_1830_length_3461_cov_4.027365_5_plen_60_part_00
MSTRLRPPTRPNIDHSAADSPPQPPTDLIRFAPVVAYYMEESSGASFSDTAGRPVYQVV